MFNFHFLFFSASLISLLDGITTKVIWMMPTWQCVGENATIHVENFGILANDKQKFEAGRVFAIFYENKFGKIPYFEGQDAQKPRNGGLPQLADLKAHLVEVGKNIEKTIPNSSFDGIAVIDIEQIRPNWELSWGKFKVYKTESISLARQKYPSWPIEIVIRQAEKDYNSACKKLFLSTLQLAKSMRPHAKWGYYLMPKCNNNVMPSTECSKIFQQFNENLKWLWNETTALFPSIYLYDKNRETTESNYYNSKALLKETQRVRDTHCRNCEIHVFSKIEYGTYNYPIDFYSKPNLDVTLRLAMELNLDGVVIWGSSANITRRCAPIGEYVERTLGPYVMVEYWWLRKCRKYRCSANGECFLPVAKRYPTVKDFQCRCDQGFTGDECEISNFD